MFRDLAFTPYNVDQYLWVIKYDEYDRYDYIYTHIKQFVVESCSTDTTDGYTYTFTQALLSNDYHGFYHECMVNS